MYVYLCVCACPFPKAVDEFSARNRWREVERRQSGHEKFASIPVKVCTKTKQTHTFMCRLCAYNIYICIRASRHPAAMSQLFGDHGETFMSHTIQRK